MNHQTDILITKRLTLRPPLEIDAEAVATALVNPKVANMLSKVPANYALDDACDWIARGKGKPCLYTIHREQLLGAVEVHNEALHPVLGFWLAEPFWGKGYMTEAARAVLARAFRFYDAPEIGSAALTKNTASLGVLEKLGFEQVGTGTLHVPSLGEGYPTVKTLLTREAFEERFGALETQRAA